MINNQRTIQTISRMRKERLLFFFYQSSFVFIYYYLLYFSGQIKNKRTLIAFSVLQLSSVIGIFLFHVYFLKSLFKKRV